jgi:hypothetical protein
LLRAFIKAQDIAPVALEATTESALRNGQLKGKEEEEEMEYICAGVEVGKRYGNRR